MADTFSLGKLITWLEKQPPGKEYRYYLSCECLLAQWVASIDPMFSESEDNSSWVYFVNGDEVDLEHFWPIAISGESTFGAALTRARKFPAA